jgi:di/tricarboxylate transporter
MKNNLVHIFLALVLVVLLVLLMDPFMYWMPPMVAMTVLLVAVVVLCVWSGFVMKEQASDEREALHRMNAGRVAYLLGIGILTLALVVQGLAHEIDPWIALTLGVMVISKLAARLYFDIYQ